MRTGRGRVVKSARQVVELALDLRLKGGSESFAVRGRTRYCGCVVVGVVTTGATVVVEAVGVVVVPGRQK